MINNSKRFILLNAVYDISLFEHTINEYQEKGYITWETKLTQLNPGDIVYIYYTNLPLEVEGRILFRSEVLESNLKLSRNEIYGNKDETPVKAIKLNNVEAISYADKETYSRSTLINKFDVNITRGGRYLDEHKNLIDSIENDSESRSSITLAKDYFNDMLKAYNDDTFCKCGKNHITFIKPDGTKYFEVHHLVPRSMIKQLVLPEDIVESSNNKFNLCSNCHNEIHYGNTDNKRALVRKLYKHNKSWYDECFKKYAEPMSILDWLYKLYNIEKSI